MQNDNGKSDVKAKDAYKKHLESEGYEDIKIISSPSDITATKNGDIYYFEIKKTSQRESYFGAATLTEWESAIKNKGRYFFVVAIELDEGKWDFVKYSPDEFIEFSTIPPFKVYFKVPLSDEEKTKQRTHTTAIRATEDKINYLSIAFDKVRDI